MENMKLINNFAILLLLICINSFGAQEAEFPCIVKDSQYLMLHTNQGCYKYFRSPTGNKSNLKECGCPGIDKSRLRLECKVIAYYNSKNQALWSIFASSLTPIPNLARWCENLDPLCKPKATAVEIRFPYIYFLNDKKEFVHSITTKIPLKIKIDKMQIEEARQFVEFDEEIAQKLTLCF